MSDCVIIVTQTNTGRQRWEGRGGGGEGGNFERLGGAHMGFPDRVENILN